jgi:hypothetical protein
VRQKCSALDGFVERDGRTRQTVEMLIGPPITPDSVDPTHGRLGVSVHCANALNHTFAAARTELGAGTPEE